MARPKAAQPMAASAVFIKSRENFLSILQQEAQHPVRAIVVATAQRFELCSRSNLGFELLFE